MKRKEILEGLAQAVVEYQEDKTVELAQQALDEGLDPFDTIMNGLAAGMKTVGDLYDRHEYFVPEILMCADALYRGLDLLKPHLNTDQADASRGQVVIGTVQGDVHDIGKNLVKMMLEVAGFTVHDLGRDVPISRFVEELHRTGSEIVALSSMMTTTMMGLKGAISAIRESNPRVSVMIGGAPVTREVAQLFGSDGYAESAGNAVREAMRLMTQMKSGAEALPVQ
ncbi:MAG: corrinoid protein [Pseudomonadota bacterium]